MQIYTNDQANHAADYRPLVIAYRNGAPVHLTDVAEVTDSVEDLRNEGLVNGKPGDPLVCFASPGANIIETVDAVKAELPHLWPPCRPPSTSRSRPIGADTIRASLQDTEWTLMVAIGLVTLIVFLFLRDIRATLIPAIAVPLSIIGTFGAMYLLGFSLNNPVLDGADHRDRLRRRRRHRRARKRHPLHRSGHATGRGRPQRRGRGRLHRDVDQHLAHRRVHPDSVHGRHSRPAVPRVRRDALVRHSHLAGAVADH